MIAAEHWQQISRRWKSVGAPLRPGEDDVRHFAELLGISRAAPFRSLILGVTPELYSLPWPEGSTVLAADRSPEMIACIWPGPAEAAHRADWLELGFADRSFDAVLCDGGLHLQGYPEGHTRLAHSVSRVLSDDGRFLLRLFALPPEPQTVHDVWGDLEQGKVANFHELKLRMAMALQTIPARGIVLGDVYDAILGHVDGRLGLIADQTGWPPEQVETIESYKNSTNSYHFLSESESVAALTASGRLVLHGRKVGRYPLGERCPLLLFQKTRVAEIPESALQLKIIGRRDGIR